MLRAWNGCNAGGRVDRSVRIFSGDGGDLLDLHAALGRADDGDPAGVAVDQQAEVELAGDVAAFLDIDALDLAALGSGLVRDELVPSMRRPPPRPRLPSGELTPPALPRPPAWICAFTTQTGPAEPARRLDRLGGGIGDPARGTATPNFASRSFA